ncbi:MAG: type II toxin-antitoxin system Phd/YefM family antitoxin [Xenococcaceae cyanobacterium]
MINLQNIHSLSEFRQNAKHYIDKLRASKAPLVLTVNGEATVVVQDAEAFQKTQEHLQALEEELRSVKIAALQRDVEVGIEQIKRGEGIRADQVFAELRKKSKELRQQHR